ncbi:restriction endonuclease or methylase [Asticcacaulis sp. AC460]|uniref:type I restriction endonuclease n=1 Tax=Asticcacaulis sp. AC460 TaxID=1282360 RepID=UPI0003C3DCF9|nr:type I restriction endonuclease [Asticcacaulis sp. AC460]ESQ87456.1 restriction endonuclease or methylase [Asticcacaulis sp. AC460]
MEFSTKLNELAAKIKQQKASIQTEEGTKTAFVLPFISKVLGYDIFDPAEVCPEFICDVGTKKGEKIDYAIMKNGQVQMLFECKKVGADLTINNASQLFRYFHVASARIGVLTNGQKYRFFTDLDNKNKMDEKPFLELDFLDIDDHIIAELFKLTKDAFDIDSIVNAAGELKYIGQIKKIISAQFASPDDDFVRFFSQKVYEGVHTQRVRELFSTLTRKALAQFLNDQTNERLKNAISANSTPMDSSIVVENKAILAPAKEDEVETTPDEMEGFYIVKAISRNVLEGKRIVFRDAKTYFSVLVDDNNRKPLCRLHLNGNKKYISVFDDNRAETRHELHSLDEIYKFSDHIITAAKLYL